VTRAPFSRSGKRSRSPLAKLSILAKWLARKTPLRKYLTSRGDFLLKVQVEVCVVLYCLCYLFAPVPKWHLKQRWNNLLYLCWKCQQKHQLTDRCENVKATSCHDKIRLHRPFQQVLLLHGTVTTNLSPGFLCAWRHTMPQPGDAGRCGPAAAHPLRLLRSARLASNSCGHNEY